MKASRLVAIVVHLQQRGGSTAERLASDLEVSVRTIYRDVSALQAAGIPLWTEPGPGGGIRLVEGWSGRLDGLTADEADALALAATPAIAAELGLGTLAAAAQSKVVAGMPPELRARALRVRERFLLDAPGWFHHDEPVEHLDSVADGVWSGHRLLLRYRRAERVVRRRVDPLGLVLKAGVWYLVAAHRGQPRTYRVGRIASVRVLDERFERPDGFDLDEWWAASGAEFDRALLRATVRVRLSAAAARHLPRVVGPTSATAGLATASPPDDEGWVTVDLPVESHEVAASQLLQLAGEVEVLEPASVRRRLRELGERLAAQHC